METMGRRDWKKGRLMGIAIATIIGITTIVTGTATTTTASATIAVTTTIAIEDDGHYCA